MTIRFNPDIYASVLAGLNINARDEQNAVEQMSTGRRVNAPSDDPAATATAIQIHWQTAQEDQFIQNVSTLQGQLQTADSTMSSIVSVLTQAIAVGTQGGNSNLSTADRTALASQLQGISQQMLSLANTGYQGRYIFAGTASNAPAYISDPTSPSGVTYNGNAGTNQVEVSPGQMITVNVPGSDLFSAPGADVFAALSNLTQAVTSGSGVDTAISQLRTAFDHVTAQRTFYGTGLKQLESAQNFLSSDKVQLANQENTAIGIDLATAITNLQKANVAQSALLSAGGKVQNLSLFDYLK